MDWLFKEEEYTPPKDKTNFIDKSILSILKVLSRLEGGAGRKAGLIYSISPALKLFMVLISILVTALARNLILIGAVTVLALLGIVLLNLRDLKKITALEGTAGSVTLLMLLPSILMGNAHNSLLILWKVILSTSLVNLLSLTSKWNDMVRALKLLFVPDIFIMVFEITLKYIYLLGRIAEESLQALKARSPGRNEKKYGSMGVLLGNLFIKSREFGDEMYSAMECRGFTGEYRGGRKND